MQTRPVIIRALGRTIVINNVAGFAIVPLDTQVMVQSVPQEWLIDYPPFGLQARIYPQAHNPGGDPIISVTPATIVAVFYDLDAAQEALDRITEHFANVIWSTPEQMRDSHASVQPIEVVCELRDLMLQGRDEHQALVQQALGAVRDEGRERREERHIELREEPTQEDPTEAPRWGRPVDLSDTEQLVVRMGFDPRNRGPQEELAARSRRTNVAPTHADMYQLLQAAQVRKMQQAEAVRQTAVRNPNYRGLDRGVDPDDAPLPMGGDRARQSNRNARDNDPVVYPGGTYAEDNDVNGDEAY